MKREKPKFIVVVGTSAGGYSALTEFISQLGEEMDAAFFIVMHLSDRGIGGYLVNQMQKFTPLFCTEVTQSTLIERGVIYFAHPGKHLIIKENEVIIGHGPEENRWRPSIDVLFRSGAVAYDGHTIGVILTGLLDDGTSGMLAIKRCGGTSIVQDPNEAEYPDMPLSVLKEMNVDFCVPLVQMGAIISKVIATKEIKETAIPPDIIKEVEITENGVQKLEELSQLGNHSMLTCPDCGGVLFELKDGSATRFRCHTGHSYSTNDLLLKQNKNLESTLWVALRTLQERKRLLTQLAEKNIERGFNRTAADYSDKISELEIHINNLKSLLFATEEEVR